MLNDSSATQTLTNGTGQLLLNNTSLFNVSGFTTINNGDGTGNGYVGFYNRSDADLIGGTTINNNGGQVEFYNISTAGYATINNDNNGRLSFDYDSNAGYATINNNGTLLIYAGSSGRPRPSPTMKLCMSRTLPIWELAIY